MTKQKKKQTCFNGDLISRMIARDPHDRPTVSQLLETFNETKQTSYITIIKTAKESISNEDVETQIVTNMVSL